MEKKIEDLNKTIDAKLHHSSLHVRKQVMRQRMETSHQFGAGHQEDEMQIEENQKNLNNKEQSINAKLPKLVITEFNGMHTYWPRLWNQCKAEIDSADVCVSPITKFSYLKVLFEPKVRVTIEGLPFTTEGYERAKTHTENQIWKGKRNCEHRRYQHNVTSSDLWI